MTQFFMYRIIIKISTFISGSNHISGNLRGRGYLGLLHLIKLITLTHHTSKYGI